MVRYHSTIERDLLYFLEFWQAVTWYCEQPMTIERVMADGKRHRYTPDYEIHKGTVKILAECKPTDRLASSHTRQQIHIGEAWSEENGYHFEIFTDTELRTGHMLANLKLLWRYARLRENPLEATILRHIRHNGQNSIHMLCKALECPPRDVLPTVCHLLFHHQLAANLHRPLVNTTQLQIKDDS
jgi:hypothetical protein